MRKWICFVIATLCIPSSMLAQKAKTFKCGGAQFKMIYVKGGTFTMGSDNGWQNEKPAHEVVLSDYYIGETEVTQQLWMAVMGKNPSLYKGDKRPVECISWRDAQAFVKKLNEATGMEFRLPTEAEWEYAAKGGSQSQRCKYSGSDDFSKVAWSTVASLDFGKGFYPKSTANVKKKKPNELGIYDMTGNVAELCQDIIAPYSSERQNNPLITEGPDNELHVIRGGDFDDADSNIERTGINSSMVSGRIGLRLVLPITAE